MEVFNNQERSGYQEIVSYGPKWWTEYREMDAVYRYAGWTLDLMAHWLERIVNNQFPIHADEKTITMFENLLGIQPEADENLEERRRMVAAYYSGTGKLSKTGIQSIIRAYTGCESELWWDQLTLQIRIYCDGEYSFSNSQVSKIIDRRIPAHIAFTMRNMLCKFELIEQLQFLLKYRFAMSWWTRSLDGFMNLDGSNILDAVRPPYIGMTRHRAYLLLQEAFFYGTRFTLPAIENINTVQIRERHRAVYTWYEGKSLDGTNYLDGDINLDQDTPPNLTKTTYRTIIAHEESMTVLMYNPAAALRLDGTGLLDGSVKLNSGREEL